MALEDHRVAVRGQGGATSWLRGEALRGPTTLTLRFELEALDPVALPRWLGSTLHGALGRALHGLDKDQLMQAVQPSAALPPHLVCARSRSGASRPTPSCRRAVCDRRPPHVGEAVLERRERFRAGRGWTLVSALDVGRS